MAQAADWGIPSYWQISRKRNPPATSWPPLPPLAFGHLPLTGGVGPPLTRGAFLTVRRRISIIHKTSVGRSSGVAADWGILLSAVFLETESSRRGRGERNIVKDRCVTPSVTACGGASSLKEGADDRAFFDKLRQGQSPCPTEFVRQASSARLE